jgi:hypothetical protein
MDRDLPFRAALVSSFVDRLKRLSPEQIRDVQTEQTPFDLYYQRAIQLATQATKAGGSDQAEACETVLRASFREIDKALGEIAGVSQRPAHMRAMAKAAARALLVRGTPPFTAGAFDELYAPFRRVIDLSDLESAARRAVSVANPPSIR